MKPYLLFLLPLAFLAWIACDGEDTPAVWDWTYQDSLQVVEALAGERDFLSSRDHLAQGRVEVEIGPDTLNVVRADTLSRRYLISSFSFSVTDSFYGYRFDPGLDTTVTAYVLDSLEGRVSLEVDSVFEPDSHTASPLDTTLERFYRYSSRGDAFLDSLGEEDTTWRIAKYSGGIRGTTPEVASAPGFDSLVLAHPGGEVIVRNTADPDVYGIRGLYPAAELIGLAPGESVSVEEIHTPPSDTLLIFLTDGKGNWQTYQPGQGFTFQEEGKQRLYVVGIRLGSLVYPSAEYSSLVWGIPLIVE